MHWHLSSLFRKTFSDSDLRSKYIFSSNNLFRRILLNSGWNEVLIVGGNFPVHVWSFVSIQTCSRPAFPVLGFCRAELQSAYFQNAQVSSTIQFIFSELAWAVKLSWLTYCSENPSPSLTSFIHMKRNWNLEFLVKE